MFAVPPYFPVSYRHSMSVNAWYVFVWKLSEGSFIASIIDACTVHPRLHDSKAITLLHLQFHYTEIVYHKCLFYSRTFD